MLLSNCWIWVLCPLWFLCHCKQSWWWTGVHCFLSREKLRFSPEPLSWEFSSTVCWLHVLVNQNVRVDHKREIMSHHRLQKFPQSILTSNEFKSLIWTCRFGRSLQRSIYFSLIYCFLPVFPELWGSGMWLFTDRVPSGNTRNICDVNTVMCPQLSTFSGGPQLAALRPPSRGSPTWTPIKQSQVRDVKF